MTKVKQIKGLDFATLEYHNKYQDKKGDGAH